MVFITRIPGWDDCNKFLVYEVIQNCLRMAEREGGFLVYRGEIKIECV